MLNTQANLIIQDGRCINGKYTLIKNTKDMTIYFTKNHNF